MPKKRRPFSFVRAMISSVLTPPSFTFDPEVLEDAFRQHPKALVLCNP